MITPCVQICTINSNKVCTGCKRTVKEISNWTRYSPSKRKQIMRELKHRDIHKE